MVFRSKRNVSFASGLLLLAGLGLSSIAPAQAGDSYGEGVKLLGARQFPKAIACFKAAVKANPKNAMAIYYLGVAQQYQGDTNSAKANYAKILADFPTSEAAKYAVRGLGSIDPNILTQLGIQAPQQSAAPQSGLRSYGSSTGSGSASNDYMPDNVRLNFERNESQHLEIDIYLNNRPMKAIFDTGAGACIFGKNDFQQAGIAAPSGKPTDTVTGVGGASAAWKTSIDLRIGQVSRKQFPVFVTENAKRPLISPAFFDAYTYTVDGPSKAIVFQKKNSGGSRGSSYGSASRDPNDVPFEVHGRSVIVEVRINGRPLKMEFDTGATMCAFTSRQLAQAGLSIPPDAGTATGSGVGGRTTYQTFPVASMRMGNVEKHDVQVSVVERADMDYPLLGQNFISDLQYSIDEANSVIHIRR